MSKRDNSPAKKSIDHMDKVLGARSAELIGIIERAGLRKVVEELELINWAPFRAYDNIMKARTNHET